MLLKVKYNDAVGLQICCFLLMIDSNLGPNSAHLRDIRLRNLSDLDFDLSKSLTGQMCHWTSYMLFPIDG